MHCEEPATGAKPLTHEVHATLPSVAAFPAGQIAQTVSFVDVQAPVDVGAEPAAHGEHAVHVLAPADA